MLAVPVAYEPSLNSGFARSAAESAYPGLWVGMTSAHMPCLGRTHSYIRDYANKQQTADVARPWVSIKGHALHMQTAGTSQYKVAVDQDVFSGNGDTVLCWYEKSDGTNRQAMTYGVNTGTAAQWFGAQTPWNGGELYAYYGGSTGNNILGPIFGRTFGNDVFIHRGGPLGHFFWQNGDLVTSKGAVTKTVSTADWGPGAFAGFGSDQAYVRALMTWNRELSEKEVAILSFDPRAPFRLRQRPMQAGIGPIELTDTEALSLSESDTLAASLQTDIQTVTINEADSVTLSTAVYRPLIIQTGQIMELPTNALIETTPPTQVLTNAETLSISRCQAVYISADDTVSLARANAIGTSRVIGLVFDESIGSTSSGNILIDQVLEATTAEWDAVTGGTGGLVANTMYYLSPSTAGNITSTATTTAGEYQVPLGVAVSSTKLRFHPGEIVLM